LVEDKGLSSAEPELSSGRPLPRFLPP